MQWNQTYGGTDDDEAYSLVQTSDGGYALAGDTSSFGADEYDLWLIKTDSAGNVEGSQKYGGSRSDGAESVIQTSDGGYALAGHTGSFGSWPADLWLVKFGPSLPPIPEFPLGLELMMALALAIPVVYLWRTHKKAPA